MEATVTEGTVTKMPITLSEDFATWWNGGAWTWKPVSD